MNVLTKNHRASMSIPHSVSTTQLSDTSTMETSSEYESELDAAHRHPYYEQWKQYYAALASYKTPQNERDPEAYYRTMNAVSPQISPDLGERNHSYFNTASPRYYNSNFEHAFEDTHNSKFLMKSRQSTIRSTRSFSVPLIAPRIQPSAISNRSVSVNVESEDSPSPKEEEEDFTGAKPSVLGSSNKVNTALLAHGLLKLTMEEQPTADISDYEAFFFNESGELEEQLVEEQNGSSSASPKEDARNSIEENSPATPDPQQQPFGHTHAILSPELTGPELERASLPQKLSQPPSLPASYGSVSRTSSRDSASSFNSLQSEKKFKVGNSRRIVDHETDSVKRASRFVPPMPGPPPPQLRNSYFQSPDASPMRNSVASFPIQNAAYLQQIQQQIQQLQQMQQMHMPGFTNGRMPFSSSPSPPPPKSTDDTINNAIEEFVYLRNIIAAGNKSFEFRLKWVKMLLEACNYKLFAYINIRGKSIPSDQIATNKQFFIKSFLTHLQKLLKELEGLSDPSDLKIFAEACYLYGCLLKHEYVPKYEQDFGIVRDDEEAERYLLKCLDMYPGFFKAHFQLGDLYEQQNTEEKFEMALAHYKESARMGFNRAIYQVAMLLLTVPSIRLTKFLKYLRNLSDINMNSKDIVLSGFDRNELEEVVGLALFQLGKIYEGIYPGDLNPEDEFIAECLEIAPVNYVKSLTYYNRAAKLHCLQAQVKLGYIYENGELNRRKNANKSIQWFIKASTSPLKFKRHPEALLGVSRWFMRGSNEESKHIPHPDPQRAVIWCERACKEFNYPEAFYVMGTYAEMGLVEGTPKEWFDNAYSLGFIPPDQIA